MSAGFMNREAFEILFRKEFKGLVVFAAGYVKDTDVAKDIVHDGFVILWEKRAEVDLSLNVKSLLTTTIRNRCLNYLRDHRKFDSGIISVEDHLSNVAAEQHDRIAEAETHARITAAIGTLPEKCREVFMLNRFENKKYKDVADTLGISVKTVEAQMSKALSILRIKLKRHDEEIRI